MIKKLMSLPYFKQAWSTIALTTVLIASGYGVFHTTPETLLGAQIGAVGSVVGILYVLGAAFGWSIANLFGALLAGFFGYLSYTQGFYGNAAINLLYSLPLSLYGLWLWNKNSSEGQLTTSRSLSDSNKHIVGGVTLAAVISSCLFSAFMGSNMWYLDGLSAVLPIMGTWFLVNMYKEQWYYWLSYNILEVIMWFVVLGAAPELIAIFVMRVVFFINSVFGYVNWNNK